MHAFEALWRMELWQWNQVITANSKFMLVWFITPFLFPFAVKQDWPCRSQFANKSNKTFYCPRFYFY